LSDEQQQYRLRNVRNVPPGLKAALIADAAREERSVTDTALCVLADYFNTDCPEAGNQPRSQPTLNDQLQLRMPRYHPLWGAFWAASKEWSTTESSVVIKVLSDHYGLPYELVRRGRKPRVVK
jgi:hypothetical protein